MRFEKVFLYFWFIPMGKLVSNYTKFWIVRGLQELIPHIKCDRTVHQFSLSVVMLKKCSTLVYHDPLMRADSSQRHYGVWIDFLYFILYPQLHMLDYYAHSVHVRPSSFRLIAGLDMIDLPWVYTVTVCNIKSVSLQLNIYM